MTVSTLAAICQNLACKINDNAETETLVLTKTPLIVANLAIPLFMVL